MKTVEVAKNSKFEQLLLKQTKVLFIIYKSIPNFECIIFYGNCLELEQFILHLSVFFFIFLFLCLFLLGTYLRSIKKRVIQPPYFTFKWIKYVYLPILNARRILKFFSWFIYGIWKCLLAKLTVLHLYCYILRSLNIKNREACSYYPVFLSYIVMTKKRIIKTLWKFSLLLRIYLK